MGGMAMAMSTSDRVVHRMLNLHRVVKSNLVAGLLQLSRTAPTTPAAPAVAPPACLLGNSPKTVVLEVDALLLKSSPPSAATLFPPFFLVAVEAGSFARGLLLLALYPFLHLMTHAMCVEAMVMVSFCGLRRDEAARIGRAVLPKYFSKEAARVEALEEAREATTSEVKVAAVSRSFPTVMVEAFLKEYVGFDAVIGRELKAGYGYFAGVMDDGKTYAERLRAALKRAEENITYRYPKPMIFHDGRLAFTPTPAARVEALEEAREATTSEVKVEAVSRSFPTVMVEAFLKEYVGFDAVIGRELKAGYGYFAGVMDDGKTYAERLRAALKRAEENITYRYPKPMIFHDGRLAFTPTPVAALAMYVYLPFAVVLSVVRISPSTPSSRGA